MGFKNCEWALKGQFRSNNRTKIYADGQTYDQKLYTFEEINYEKEFINLNIFVKRVESSIQSVSMEDKESIKGPSSRSLSAKSPKKNLLKNDNK